MFKRLLSDSLSLVFGNLEAVFKFAGSWFALQFLLSLVILGVTGEMPDSMEPAMPNASHLALGLVMSVLVITSSASISVGWHRFGLLGEQPATFHLRLGKIEMQFIWKIIQIMLISFLILIPLGGIGFLLVSPLPTEIGGVLLGGLFLFVVFPTLFRFNLVLPATAVERPLSFMEAFELGKGLGWRMFWATVVLSIPFSLTSVLLQFLLGAVGGGLPVFLIQMKVMLLNVLLQVILTVLMISVITAGYRIAMERAYNPTGEAENRN